MHDLAVREVEYDERLLSGLLELRQELIFLRIDDGGGARDGLPGRGAAEEDPVSWRAKDLERGHVEESLCYGCGGTANESEW